MPTKSRARVVDAELAELRERLREAEDTLAAIRGGHVDALVIQGPDGEQVFTLRGADHRYRQLVETMSEGALLVDPDGIITYGNARFAALAGVPLERLISSRLTDYIPDEWRATVRSLIAGRDASTKAEVELVTAAGDRTPVYLSATAIWNEDEQLTGVIVTDLAAQKRDRELLAAAGLSSSIVEQSAEGVVVCDPSGRVIRASHSAQRAAGLNPLLRPFPDVFGVRDGDGRAAAQALLEETWRGETISGRELTLEPTAAPAIDVLLSAAPIHGRDGELFGSVISFIDITDRKRLGAERLALLEAAQAARADAEAASRAKDEFLAMLGHELRNPLAPILTALELMRERTIEVPNERKIIERQVRHVVTLVDDLLDVSRITRGKIELDVHPIELAQVIGRAVELAGPLIEERGHALDVDVAVGLRVLADETRLAQVFSNLLVNAAKYTERGGAIWIRGARVGGEVVIHVRDNGMGIPAEILPHLFERFVQGARTIDRAEGGLGLGLAIVSSLVALHGGTVSARSTGAGQGSELEVRLPALVDPRADDTAETGPRQAIRGRSLASDAIDTPRRVLVVDDNVDAAEMLAEALVHLGHTAGVAYDGPSALDRAVELRPEVAVLDLGLPGMDGFELARQMRRQLADPALRLIALTGYGQDSDRLRSLEAGFDAHLTKPVDLRVLARTIRQVIGAAVQPG